MKKKILLTSIVGVMALGLGVGVSSIEHDAIKASALEAVIDVPATGVDVRGGVHPSYTYLNAEGYTAAIISMKNQVVEGDMLYIRVRNHIGIETPYVLHIADGGIGSFGGSQYGIPSWDLNYYLYDAFGCDEIEKTYWKANQDDPAKYIQIPSFFDGIVGVNLSDFTVDNWGSGREMNKSLVWNLYWQLQPKYNSFANVTFGDVFNAAGMNIDVSNDLNGSGWTALVSEWEAATVPNTLNLSRALLTDFDASNKDLAGGTEIKVPADAYVTADICDAADPLGVIPKQIHGSMVWARIRNFAGDTSIQIQVMGCEGDNRVPQEGKPFYFYDVNGNHIATNFGIQGNLVVLPSKLNGFIGVPLASLVNVNIDKPINNWLWGIFLSAWGGAHLVVGDVFCQHQFAGGTSFQALLRDGSANTWEKYKTLRHGGNTSLTRIYPGFADDDASAFATEFLSTDCTAYTDDDWAWYEMAFGELSPEMANYIATTDYTGKTDDELNIVEKAVQRYDLAVVRQGRTQFIASRNVSNYTNALSLYTEGNMDLILTVVICITLVAAFGACLLLNKKRREQN